MGIKVPRLIQDRCGVFYFRFLVPLNWRGTVGKTELRRSLRTKDAGAARQAALLLSARMEEFVATSKSMPPELLAWMKGNEAFKLKVRIYDNGAADIEADTLEEADAARAIVADLARARSAARAAVGELPSSRCGTNLDKAAEDFVAERRTTLSEKGTMPKVRGVLRAFNAFAGNADVAMVGPAVVGGYKKQMLARRLAPTTINDHLVVLTGFFDYCIDNQLVRMANPARGLLIPGAHNKAESYEPFTNGELARIFAPGPYLKRMRMPDCHWGPLIAAFTGARAEEIASLDAKDVYPVKGVWIFDITKGKTANAVRRVPIHVKLLELGFLDYHKAIADAGHARLFPHLVDGKNGYKKNMCRMFGNHLDATEVDVKHPLKVFHSFRHTVVTALTDAGVNDGLKRALVGHDIDTRESSHDDYIHARFLTLANLQEAINKLAYEGVDFEGLRIEPVVFLAAVAKRIAEQEKAALKELAGSGEIA